MANQTGDPATSSGSTVFIDTNLNTHLAMIVSPSDSVLDLKKKIMSEHPKCFPECGKIKVNSLKVKRKGFLYHLSDTMLVQSAFEGAKKCWFLSVNASSIKQANENQMPNKPEATNQPPLKCSTKATSGDRSNHQALSSSNQINNSHGPGISGNEVQKDLEMEVGNVSADHCSQVFSDFNCKLGSSSQHQEPQSERHVVPETNVQLKGGDSQVRVNDDQCNYPPEGSTRIEPVVSKKRKSKKHKAAISNFTLEDGVNTSGHFSGKAVTEPPNEEMKNMAACGIVAETNGNQGDDDCQDPNNPLEGSLSSEPGTNGKHTSNKKTQDSLPKCTLQNDIVDIHEHYSDKEVGEVLDDVEMVNIDAVKGPCSKFLDDAMLRTNAGEFLRKSSEIRDNESKAMVCDGQDNASPEEASKSIPALKKRKRRETKGADNPQEEDNGTPVRDAVLGNSTIIGEQNNTTTRESLTTKMPEDVDLVAGTSTKKRRKKKRSSREQEVFVDPPSSQNAEEGRKEDAEDVTMNVDKDNAEEIVNDIGKVSDSVIITESDVQLSIPCSGVGMRVREHNVASAEIRSAAAELVPKSGSKGTKNSEEGHSTSLDGLSPPAVVASGNSKDDTIAAGEDSLRDDHDTNIKDHDTEVVEKESPHNRGIEEMISEKWENLIQSEVIGQSKVVVTSANQAEPNNNMEPGKSSGKRLKKRARKPVADKVVVSSVERSDDHGGLSPSALHDVRTAAKEMFSLLSQTNVPEPIRVDTSLDFANGAGTNTLPRSEGECLPPTQINKSQENEDIGQEKLGEEAAKKSHIKERENEMDLPQENIVSIIPKNTEVSDAKCRKKMKKNQVSIDETHSAPPIRGQKVGPEELISLDKKSNLGKSRSKYQTSGEYSKPVKYIGDGHGNLTIVADPTQAPLSGIHKGSSIELTCEHADGVDANRPVDVSKSPEIAVKAKNSSSVPVENGNERKSYPKNSTVKDHKDGKRPTLSTKKEMEQKVSLDSTRSTVAKSSSKRKGRVVNSSQGQKSLLATPDSIFWDNSSEGSEGADTRTKAPLGNSSSSSDPKEEGADGASGADYGESKKETVTPHSKSVDMKASQSTFRRSSRLKNVKATAAKYQVEGTKSQPVELS